MKGVIETIPSFIYIIVAVAVGIFLFSLLYNYSDLFVQKQVVLEGDKNYIAKKIANEIENCWKQHRNGLDSVSGICKKLTIKSTDYFTEKDVTGFLDCQSIPNINCTPENCSFCISDYFDDQDKIKWFVENKKATIEISYLGFERVIKVSEILVEEVCEPYDRICDAACSYVSGICDKYCYRNNLEEGVPCDFDCVDYNKDGKIDLNDLDEICDLDCYNNKTDIQSAYDIDCIWRNRNDNDGICDPDTQVKLDGVCDPDCAKQNFICDFDCNGTTYNGNLGGLNDSDCSGCDEICNGICLPACEKGEDPDCKDGFKGIDSLTECCGNQKCGSSENCENCPNDCPAGATCRDSNKVCCPDSFDSDEFGCSAKDLAEEESCFCDSQCKGNLICISHHCCPVGTFWSSSENNCTNRTDVLIVALKGNLESVYSSAQITQLENKIKEYKEALARDGLGSIFLYLDKDETSDLIGTKVSNTGDWNEVDGVLDQLIPKLNSGYVLIIGGYDRFPSARVGAYYTDNHYSDYTKDNIPDVALGRLPEPNKGDIDLFINSFDTFIDSHNSGGLDLSSHIGRTLDYGYASMECWSEYIWGQRCQPYPKCRAGTGDSKTAASGKGFFYLTQHGGLGPPQEYADALTPNSLNGMDLSNAVWMIVPCYGGVIDYGSTSQGIVLTFFRRGGAIHMGSTNTNCCASPAGICTASIDSRGVGALYYRVAKNFVEGTRVGDAYKTGKTEYKRDIGNGPGYEFYINCLYGDPTLKIKKTW